jgi:hypothetical protein
MRMAFHFFPESHPRLTPQNFNYIQKLYVEQHKLHAHLSHFEQSDDHEGPSATIKATDRFPQPDEERKEASLRTACDAKDITHFSQREHRAAFSRALRLNRHHIR